MALFPLKSFLLFCLICGSSVSVPFGANFLVVFWCVWGLGRCSWERTRASECAVAREQISLIACSISPCIAMALCLRSQVSMSRSQARSYVHFGPLVASMLEAFWHLDSDFAALEGAKATRAGAIISSNKRIPSSNKQILSSNKRYFG